MHHWFQLNELFGLLFVSGLWIYNGLGWLSQVPQCNKQFVLWCKKCITTQKKPSWSPISLTWIHFTAYYNAHHWPYIATLICKAAFCINHVSSFSRKMVSIGHHLFAFGRSFGRLFCALLEILVFSVCQHNIFSALGIGPQFVGSKLFQCHYYYYYYLFDQYNVQQTSYNSTRQNINGEKKQL